MNGKLSKIGFGNITRWQPRRLLKSALVFSFSTALIAGCTSPQTKYEPGSKLSEAKAVSEKVSQNTTEQAMVTVDFEKPEGKRLRTETYNTWDNGDPAPELRAGDVEFLDKQGLHSKLVRIGFKLKELCDVNTNTCDFASISQWVDDISRSTDSLMVHLTPNHIMHEKLPPQSAKDLLKTAIKQLKLRFPKIDYIEATNEPDWEYHGLQVYSRKTPILQPAEVYAYYVPFYQAVNEVNADLSIAQQIKVGGPAITGLTDYWLGAFLAGYANDSNPDKKLDFISYHGYGQFSNDFKKYRANKIDPSLLGKQREQIDRLLTEQGLKAGIPAYITETGIYPGPSFDEKDPSKNDYLRQAAGLASQHFWWAEQDKIYPFNWVVRHATQGRKDQLITHAPEGPQVDTFSPYGNMLLMQSKLKGTKVNTVSDSLKEGQGVYAIGTKDNTGASVMLWNYQHINDKSYRATVQLENLPSVLKGKQVRVQRYLIDNETSNYWNDPESANLQMVAEEQVNVGSDFSLTIDLPPNAIQLILLEQIK